MSQFQTLIRSSDSPLNIQTLISVVFIDATMPLLELASGLVENVPDTNMTRKMILLIMCCIFGDNYIFVENFNTSSRSYQPNP